MAKLFEFYQSEPDPTDKQDKPFRRYGDFDKNSRTGLESIRLTPVSEHITGGGEPKTDLTILWRSGRSVVDEAIPELLKDLGIEFSQPDTPAGRIRYEAQELTHAQVAQVLKALATTKHLDKGRSAYAVVGPETAAAIMENEVRQYGATAADFGMWSPSIERMDASRTEMLGLNEPFNYLAPSIISDSRSPVTEVGEDAIFVSRPITRAEKEKGALEDVRGFEIDTTLTINNLKDAEAIAELLGAELGAWNKSRPNEVTVKGMPADKVMAKLKGVKDIDLSAITTEKAVVLSVRNQKDAEAITSVLGGHARENGAGYIIKAFEKDKAEVLAKLEGKVAPNAFNAEEEVTLTTPSLRDSEAVAAVLGLEGREWDRTDGYKVTVTETTADVVMEKLKGRFVPPIIADEISSEAQKLHPEQKEVHDLLKDKREALKRNRGIKRDPGLVEVVTR